VPRRWVLRCQNQDAADALEALKDAENDADDATRFLAQRSLKKITAEPVGPKTPAELLIFDDLTSSGAFQVQRLSALECRVRARVG
jgi:hypothetical protein